MNGDETLVRVEYSVASATMRGADFSIDVAPGKINSARSFSERELDYLSVENTALTDAQWKEINDAVQAIAPLLEETKPASEKENDHFFDFLPQPLDGVDSSSFFLTWKTPDGEARIQYAIPADRRFTTLIEILHETTDPIGREIVYYDAPVLTGLHLRQDSLLPFERYSYQCTVKNEGSDERYLFAYYYDGESASYSTTVYADTWNLIAEKCAELGIEELDTVSSDKKTACTLYFSDQTQRTVELDRQARQEMRVLFEQIVADLKD